MLGEHSEEVCMSAYNYGRHLGLAFQLMDDALDFKASAEALVRPATLNLFSLVPALLNKASAWRKLLSPHLQRH